jgi:hypothetical protein
MIAGPEHERCFQDIVKALRKHSDNMSSVEILAVLSNMLGKVMAQQDQRVYSSERVLEIVRANIEIGNRQAVEALMKSEGGKQ